MPPEDASPGSRLHYPRRRTPLLAKQRLYRWTRDLHLYIGLFISPFVLLYAVTVFLLTHAFMPWGGTDEAEPTTRTLTLTLPREENSLEMARSIRDQIGASAEIDYVNLNQERKRLTFPLTKPGERSTVRVDLATGVTEIETHNTGVWDAMIYLHMMPGPHNVAIRGNWFFTRLWGWLADGTVYLILFVTATGVYLWSVLRSERRTGLILLGSGALSFVIIVLALIS